MQGGVFVCHASQDAGMAARVVAALEAAGLPCWIAPRDIEAGENYTHAILTGLAAAPAVVLVFSAATNDSPHVLRELEMAVSDGRTIIPVRLEPVEPNQSLRYFIGTSQWLDTSGVLAEQWEPPLVRAVRRVLAAAGPAPRPAVTPGLVDPSPHTGSGWSRRTRLLAAVGAGVALVAIVAVTLSVTGGDPEPVSTAPLRTTSSADGEPVTTAPSGEPTPSEPTVGATATGPVTCWDGTRQPSRRRCPPPKGRIGMATVFPGLTDACTSIDSPVSGKAEVYECVHDGFLVRYSRWLAGIDKEAYYSVENRVESTPWQVGGEDAGLQWLSIDDDPAETQPYQWSAAYTDFPFSVSVEADTSADRSAGIAELALTPPSRIGLR